jgi:preprotein translocase subunit SecG
VLALLFTPQQTKYFGGLATQFKQSGFFATYERSEDFVHRISWFFLFVFFQSSFFLR